MCVCVCVCVCVRACMRACVCVCPGGACGSVVYRCVNKKKKNEEKGYFLELDSAQRCHHLRYEKCYFCRKRVCFFLQVC